MKEIEYYSHNERKIGAEENKDAVDKYLNLRRKMDANPTGVMPEEFREYFQLGETVSTADAQNVDLGEKSTIGCKLENEYRNKAKAHRTAKLGFLHEEGAEFFRNEAKSLRDEASTIRHNAESPEDKLSVRIAKGEVELDVPEQNEWKALISDALARRCAEFKPLRQ